MPLSKNLNVKEYPLRSDEGGIRIPIKWSKAGLGPCHKKECLLVLVSTELALRIFTEVYISGWPLPFLERNQSGSACGPSSPTKQV